MTNNEKAKLPEVWMRGPVDNVPAMLQPVAHALLQASEEVEAIMNNFPQQKLWENPSGMASAAFHLQHIPGVIDRLFTYAYDRQLNNEQLKYLSEEGLENDKLKVADLVQYLQDRIQQTVAELKTFDMATLTDTRGVGRKRLPTTVMGLIFHAAEHTMRHVGQLLVTVAVVKGER